MKIFIYYIEWLAYKFRTEDESTMMSAFAVHEEIGGCFDYGVNNSGWFR